jgi:hypothetical protein
MLITCSILVNDVSYDFDHYFDIVLHANNMHENKKLCDTKMSSFLKVTSCKILNSKFLDCRKFTYTGIVENLYIDTLQLDNLKTIINI